MSFCSPIAGKYTVTSYYGYRKNPFNPTSKGAWFHNGIDIVSYEGQGAPIYAIADGIVKEIKRATYIDDDSVELVKIEHSSAESGIAFTRYVHLFPTSTSHLTEGMQVLKGDEIGKMGTTGRSTGAHLHFDVYDTDGKRVDPYSVLSLTSGVVQERVVLREDNKEYKGKPVKVKVTSKREVRNGRYESSREQERPEPLAYSKPLGEFTKKGEVSAEGFIKQKQELMKKEDLEASLLSFYFPKIIKYRKEQLSETKPHNLIYLKSGKNTPYIQNLIFGKGFKKQKNDFSMIKNTELANMVPYVEMYAIKLGENNKQTQVLYPFDDYVNKTKLDSIFYDKTGRGGIVGIRSVDWETLATNPANKRLVSVKIKIEIQDIQEIETIRNGISLLDFLYPSGTRKPDVYDNSNFNVKLNLGWLYKRENNFSLNNLENKINEKMLSESIYVSLHKHSFEFQDSGKVELNLEYYGMIETEADNEERYDILEQLNPKAKSFQGQQKIYEEVLKELESWDIESAVRLSTNKLLVGSIKTESMAAGEKERGTYKKRIFVSFSFPNNEMEPTFLYSTQQQQVIDPATGKLVVREVVDSAEEKVSKKIKEAIQDEIQRIRGDLKESYVDSFTNFIREVSSDKKLNILSINEETLKTILSLQTENRYFNQASFEKLKNAINNVNEKAKTTTAEVPTQNETEKKDKRITDDNLHINADEYVKNIIAKQEEKGMQVPYIFLSDVLSYFLRLFYPNYANVAYNKELRIVLGDFSYRDIGELLQDDPERNSDVVKLTNQNDGTYKSYSINKKYANIGDIPISIKSLVNWYNTNVLDSSLEKMSLNKFLRSLFSSVVPANMRPNLLNIVPKRTVVPTYGFCTVPLNNDVEAELQTSKPIFTIDMSNDKFSNSSFYRLRQKAVEKSKNIKQDEQKVNYMFIFSGNEKDETLTSDYKTDLEKDIYHFYIAEETGLVKNIKFSREDNKKLDSANINKAYKGDTGNQIIRQLYQAEIEMFGNTIFQPGQLLHITPTYPGARLKNKTLYRIGLGGYYRIVKINSYIEDSKFETKINAKWEMNGDGEHRYEKGSLFLDMEDATAADVGD